MEDKAVEKTEDEAGAGTAEGDDCEVSVLDVQHDVAPRLMVVTAAHPPNILSELSVYQSLLFTRRRHFHKRSLEDSSQPRCLIVTLG